MSTYKLIASSTVGSGGASSITFSSIPNTYTDLYLLVTSKVTSNNYIKLNINSDTGSNYTYKVLRGASGTPGSLAYLTQSDWTGAALLFGYSDSDWTSSAVYIPDYASSRTKTFSSDSVQEANTSLVYYWLGAGKWNSTAAITTIAIANQTQNFAQYSTAWLYGISNA